MAHDEQGWTNLYPGKWERRLPDGTRLIAVRTRMGGWMVSHGKVCVSARSQKLAEAKRRGNLYIDEQAKQ